MECRPLQNNETEITENYIHRDKEDDTGESYLSHEELEEYKKIQEEFLTFSNAKITNKSDLRKSLLNIASNLMRLLVFLENTPNQESTGFAAKVKANHRFNEYDKSSSKDQCIPKKPNGQFGQMKDRKDEQIPRVTIKRVSSSNKPGCVAYINKSLYENEEYRIDMQEPDSGSSQYIPFLQEYATQTLLQKDEICNVQWNNETEIVFECKNVKPTVTSRTPQKLDYLSQNQLQDAKISEATRATIKDERLDMIKNDNVEKLDINIHCEPNGQNEKVTLKECSKTSEKSEKFNTHPKKFVRNSNLKILKQTARDRITHLCDICGKKFMQKHKLKIHTEVAHNGRKRHKCDTCGKTYVTKATLYRHTKSLHNGITHGCDSCGKTFARKDNLKIHIDSVHKGLTHPCDICRKVFITKNSLELHKHSLHKGITYPCNLCRKVFFQKSHLKRHNDSVHNGITHQCDQCEKSFTRKTNLKLHIDDIHN